ncbi:ATP-binding protein [Streptomyces sp. NBC_01643]|uniref:ATP-binding protein n=1 Tax=Streptomyces sp. NBC_01643 TaxID=2975906 RepID=UPI002F917AD4|nr:ATP-binding protein [Streptomyces sp. NBC_01643]
MTAPGTIREISRADGDFDASSVQVQPATPAELTIGCLKLLRDAVDRVMREYRQAWDSAGQAGAGRPELQTVAGIGLRPDPVTAAAGDPVGLFPGLGLSASAEAVIAAAWWAVVDPQLAAAFGWIHDDATRRYPSLSALRLLLEPYGLAVPLALPEDSGPVADGLLRPVADAAAPVRLTPTAALLLDGWQPPATQLVSVPPRLSAVADEARALITAGHRVSLRCADEEDGPVLAGAIAARLERALDDGQQRPVAETLLLERLGLVLPWGAEETPPARLRLTLPGAPSAPGWQVLDVAAIETTGVTREWRRVLGASGLDTSAAGQLAARMRLTEATITSLHATARAAAEVQRRHLTVADLHSAVRRHPQHQLDGMARLVPPSQRLSDLVLPEPTLAGLHDLLAHARHSSGVLAGFPGAGMRGRGVAALLHGPSGTGKTAATEAIAAELDRDLWIVDLAQVVSKWLGETSRNLDRLLTQAARAGAVLLFDEAEGLFGRRAEVTDARDRYANLEIDHLLQRIELHEGLCVLTSNRPAALDDGFQRRLRLSVRFELPDHTARQAIWASLLLADRFADGTDLEDVAAAELSGSSIRAAAVAAQIYAASDGAAVGAQHLHRAVRRELEKSGRTWAPITATRGSR